MSEMGASVAGPSRARTRTGTWTRPVGWALLGLILFFLGLELAWSLVTMPHVDWETYVDAWHRSVSGQGLYSAGQLEGPYVTMSTEWVGFVYPPAAAVLLAPLAIPVIGPALWYTLSIGTFLGGLAAVVRREVGYLLPWPLALAFAPLLIIAPFWDGVITGNVNLLAVGSLAWAWAAPGRWIGPVSGVLAVLRVFPGSLGVQRVRATGWRGLIVPVGTAAAIVLLTLPIVGLGAWHDYVVAVGNAVPQCTKEVNSLACALDTATGPASAKVLVLLLTGFLLVGSLVARSPLVSYALVAFAWVVPMPDLSPNYLLAPLLPLYVLAARAYGRRGAAKEAADLVPRASRRPDSDEASRGW